MNPKQKAESAAKAYLDSFPVSIPVYKGIENTMNVDEEAARERRQVPCSTVAIEGDLTEAIPFTGNWEGELTVSVEANAQTVKDSEFDTLCREIFSKFETSDLRSDLSAALSDFTCLFAIMSQPSGRFTQGNNWILTLRIHLVFCERDL